jgi:hypothetical protein
MSGRCANPMCSVPRLPEEGKLFRLDIEIGNADGTCGTKTAFVWLCGQCSQAMNPKIEVAGNTVKVLLAAHPVMPVAARPSAGTCIN